MPSEIDIANLALSHLGEDANVSSFDPPEGGPHAELCARWYPIARDAMLEMHAWNFALARVSPPARDSEASSWLYAYPLPAECISVVSVLPPDAMNDYASLVIDGYSSYQPQGFAVERLTDGTVVVYTNAADAQLRYTKRVTDTSRFPPLFVIALARLLASYLAGPIIKGDVGRNEAKGHLQIFQMELRQATASDAGQQNNDIKAVTPWMVGRL